MSKPLKHWEKYKKTTLEVSKAKFSGNTNKEEISKVELRECQNWIEEINTGC